MDLASGCLSALQQWSHPFLVVWWTAGADAYYGHQLGQLAVAQATDTDGDGLPDSWEQQYFGDLSRDGSGDFEGDGIINADEFSYGFNPSIDDAYRDADGDRYPNVFEVAKGTSPTDALAVPSADFFVDLVNGSASTTDNVYPSVTAAITASGTDATQYRIIGLRAGTYTGASNVAFHVAANRPHLLIIGLDGAAQTVIDGEQLRRGPYSYRRVALSSMTIRRTLNYPVSLNSASGSLLSDLVIASNSAYYGAVYVHGSNDVVLSNCSVFNNVSSYSATGLYAYNASVQVESSVLWNSGTLFRDVYERCRQHFGDVQPDPQ